MVQNLQRRTFLLSPANLSGRRAAQLLGSAARGELASRLRTAGAPLGEVFSFISALYFRGKLAYANAFANASTVASASVFVITAGRGLLSPHECITHGHLKEMALVSIGTADPRYTAPLERDATRLAAAMEEDHEVVLLGSIATSKYLLPLSGIFGGRLMIPSAFIGRGDMSRGALMLAAVRSGSPLEYVSAQSHLPDATKRKSRSRPVRSRATAG